MVILLLKRRSKDWKRGGSLQREGQLIDLTVRVPFKNQLLMKRFSTGRLTVVNNHQSQLSVLGLSPTLINGRRRNQTGQIQEKSHMGTEQNACNCIATVMKCLIHLKLLFL